MFPAKKQSDVERVKQWHLTLPPAAVLLLLKAVCVDETGGPRAWERVTQMLWGAKRWVLRPQGQAWRIDHLRGGSSSGDLTCATIEIQPINAGSVVLLRGYGLRLRRLLRLILTCFVVLSFSLILVILALIQPPNERGVQSLLTVGALVWAIALLLLVVFRWNVGLEQTDFLDDVFDDYLIPDPTPGSPAQQATHVSPTP